MTPNPYNKMGHQYPFIFKKQHEERTGKINRKRHLEKADKMTENCFVAPTVITIKKNKLVKIALESRKLNELCIKRKATMPNMEELFSKILAKITRSNGEIWMSKIDLDYAS